MLLFAVDVVGYFLQHEATILLPQGKPHGSPFQSSGNKGPAHVAAADDGRRKIRRGGETLPSKRPNGEVTGLSFGDKVK